MQSLGAAARPPLRSRVIPAAAQQTLGVDLAAQAANTGMCLLHWVDGRGSDGGQAPVVGVTDADLLTAMRRADLSAIDAPFGWPDEFRATVHAWAETGRWNTAAATDHLRFRRTDLDQHAHGRLPLSVSTDRIGITAMRCARVLDAHARPTLEPLDRVRGSAIEVYPAAALLLWDIPAKGYKNRDAYDRRDEIVTKLQREAGLDLCAATRERCVAKDHALDALVCSLVARAYSRGLTEPVPADDDGRIAREGWIHLPVQGSLPRLGGRRLNDRACGSQRAAVHRAHVPSSCVPRRNQKAPSQSATHGGSPTATAWSSASDA